MTVLRAWGAQGTMAMIAVQSLLVLRAISSYRG
jgi:hypothetical protein